MAACCYALLIRQIADVWTFYQLDASCHVALGSLAVCSILTSLLFPFPFAVLSAISISVVESGGSPFRSNSGTRGRGRSPSSRHSSISSHSASSLPLSMPKPAVRAADSPPETSTPNLSEAWNREKVVASVPSREGECV